MELSEFKERLQSCISSKLDGRFEGKSEYIISGKC